MLYVVLNNLLGQISNKSSDELQTRSFNAPFILNIEEVPENVGLFAFCRLVQLKNLNKLLVIISLLVNTPFFYKRERVGECLQYTTGHTIENFFVCLFVLARIVNALLELQIAEV